ncbi:MAG: hypothetical protein SGPRY_001977 [Prymnesium sp.]
MVNDKKSVPSAPNLARLSTGGWSDRAFMHARHSVWFSQDLRRARSGMLNLAPTSTGSATAVAEVFPELKGKLNGLAIRVPMLNSSITDMVFVVGRDTSVDEVNAMLKKASEPGSDLAETEGVLRRFSSFRVANREIQANCSLYCRAWCYIGLRN